MNFIRFRVRERAAPTSANPKWFRESSSHFGKSTSSLLTRIFFRRPRVLRFNLEFSQVCGSLVKKMVIFSRVWQTEFFLGPAKHTARERIYWKWFCRVAYRPIFRDLPGWLSIHSDTFRRSFWRKFLFFSSSSLWMNCEQFNSLVTHRRYASGGLKQRIVAKEVVFFLYFIFAEKFNTGRSDRLVHWATQKSHTFILFYFLFYSLCWVYNSAFDWLLLVFCKIRCFALPRFRQNWMPTKRK